MNEHLTDEQLGKALDENDRLRAKLAGIEDLPTIAADMLNAWYAPSNPHTGTAEDYRELKHRLYGQRDFDGMVTILSAALGGLLRAGAIRFDADAGRYHHA